MAIGALNLSDGLPISSKAKLSDGSTVHLRLLTRADRDALLGFTSALSEHDRLFLRTDITDPTVVDGWLDNIDAGRTVTVIAQDGGAILGFGSLHFSNAQWSQHVGELRVIVGEAGRGRGLGRRLSEAIFAVALERGLEKMVAQMTLDQQGAVSTFEKLGFKAEALLRDHVKDRQGRKHDLLVMAHDVVAFQSQLSAYGIGASEGDA